MHGPAHVHGYFRTGQVYTLLSCSAQKVAAMLSCKAFAFVLPRCCCYYIGSGFLCQLPFFTTLHSCISVSTRHSCVQCPMKCQVVKHLIHSLLVWYQYLIACSRLVASKLCSQWEPGSNVDNASKDDTKLVWNISYPVVSWRLAH